MVDAFRDVYSSKFSLIILVSFQQQNNLNYQATNFTVRA